MRFAWGRAKSEGEPPAQRHAQPAGVGPAPVQASVIIPAFNAAEHIDAQLRALARQQTTVSWDLIVADNGSSDETVAIVRRFASDYPVPVRIVDASARRGVAAARNIGADVAEAPLLLFADADDVVDERWVQEMVLALREQPFVGGKVEVTELNGEEIASWRRSGPDDDLPRLGGCPWVRGCNFGCTAAALALVGGFDESSGYGEDVELSLRMCQHGITAVFAERAIVHYRYRHRPWDVVRQVRNYGAAHASLYARYGIAPPSLLDGLILFYRAVKQAAREVLRGRRPVGPAADIAYALGEASVVWRDRAFWRPVTRRYRVASPLHVYLSRMARLARWVTSTYRPPR